MCVGGIEKPCWADTANKVKGKSLLKTWGKHSVTFCSSSDSEGPGHHLRSLFQDQLGQLTHDGLSQVHWVSFLDGRQRVLLFTDDVAVVTKARQAEDLEQFQQEVKVSLQNLGLSLINSSRRQEIAYIGITRYTAQTFAAVASEAIQIIITLIQMNP